MKQKFRKLTFVKAARKSLKRGIISDKGFIGIIEGTHSQLCGDKNINSYAIFRIEGKKIVFSTAWYDEDQLTKLPIQDRKKAAKMIKEYLLKS